MAKTVTLTESLISRETFHPQRDKCITSPVANLVAGASVRQVLVRRKLCEM